MKSSERNVISMTIRNGIACVLALGVVVGLAAVPALSDDSLPTALGSAQPNVVSSTSNENEIILPESNILINPISRPLISCCVPVTPPPPPGDPQFTCLTVPTTLAQCRAAFGYPARSCGHCLFSAPSVSNTEIEVETLGDDDPVAEQVHPTPIGSGFGSAWTLLIATLFFASL